MCGLNLIGVALQYWEILIRIFWQMEVLGAKGGFPALTILPTRPNGCDSVAMGDYMQVSNYSIMKYHSNFCD